jgi:hypothetical protein
VYVPAWEKIIPPNTSKERGPSALKYIKGKEKGKEKRRKGRRKKKEKEMKDECLTLL